MILAIFLRLIFVIAVIGCNVPRNTANTSPPIVQTKLGAIQGRYHVSRNGLQYLAFLGIKFGYVPQRFEPSVPARPWEGVLDATKFSSHCAQMTLLYGRPAATGSEDCLSLNIFTPKADNKKRPVLFYVHGGGFSAGSNAEYLNGFLIDEDVILVTVNYRLGVLGFLNTRDDLIHGNMGLKDQLLALKWVNQNIETFGGDPNRVTLGGNSAGASSVLHLMVNPGAKGLFVGVYGTSGSPFNRWSFLNDTNSEMTELGQLLNCRAKNNVELVKCLREEPIEGLMRAQQEVGDWDLDFFKMRPTAEIKSIRNPIPALVKSPENIISEGEFPRVPVLLTITRDEGIMIYSAAAFQIKRLLADLNANFTHVAPITFMYNQDPVLKTQLDDVTEKIRQFYFRGGIIDENTKDALTELYADSYFNYGITKYAQALASKTSVYTGLFTYERRGFSPAHVFGIDIEKARGVSHCDDLSYFLEPSGETDLVPLPYLGALKTTRDNEFSKKFTKVIANFVSTGIPKIEFGSRPNWYPVTKQEINSNTLNWMELNDRPDISLLINPFRERIGFWDKLHNIN